MASFQILEKTIAGRSYWEALIGVASAESPIVIIMHWMTGTASAMSFLFEGMKNPARLIFLQGAYPSGYEVGGYSWYPQGTEFYELSELEQTPFIREEAAKIASFIAQIKELHQGKIIVTGMSQGGDLSLFLATYHSDVIDLAIPCAGRLSPVMRETLDPQPSCQIRMQQGKDDTIVSLDSAREVFQWLQAKNFDVSLDEYDDLGHDFSAQMIARIQGLIG